MASTLLGAGWRREWGGIAAAAVRWAEAALGRAPAAAAAEEGAWLMGKRDARTRKGKIFRGSNGRMRPKAKNVEVNQWIPRPALAAPAAAAPPAEPRAAAALAFARLHLAV